MALTNKGNFIINNIEFKPKSIKQTFESLASEDSGRTDDGVMHITWIKPKLRKWEIEMPPTNYSWAYTLLSLVQGQVYNITIWDLSSNSEVTVHVYTSNSTADCYSGVIKDGLYNGLSFSAIEVGDD